MLRIALPCLLTAGLVVGCAPSQATSDVVSAAAVSSAPAPATATAEPESTEGVYRGRATPLNRSGRCGNFRDPTIRIHNNLIVRRFGNNRLTATIQPDGTFSAQAGRTRMYGTVQDGRLDATVGNEYCSYRYALRRS